MTPDPKNWRDEMYPDTDGWREADDAVLARVKAVARRAADRCRPLTGETQIDHRPLPPDTTGQHPG
jgi:hypothetical protein